MIFAVRTRTDGIIILIKAANVTSFVMEPGVRQIRLTTDTNRPRANFAGIFNPIASS